MAGTCADTGWLETWMLRHSPLRLPTDPPFPMPRCPTSNPLAPCTQKLYDHFTAGRHRSREKHASQCSWSGATLEWKTHKEAPKTDSACATTGAPFTTNGRTVSAPTQRTKRSWRVRTQAHLHGGREGCRIQHERPSEAPENRHAREHARLFA